MSDYFAIRKNVTKLVYTLVEKFYRVKQDTFNGLVRELRRKIISEQNSEEFEQLIAKYRLHDRRVGGRFLRLTRYGLVSSRVNLDEETFARLTNLKEKTHLFRQKP
jgi:hypothetical protein